MLDFTGYEPYQMLHPRLPEDLPRAQAVEEYEHLMAAKAERKEQVLGLLRRNGLEFAGDDRSLAALVPWIAEHAEADAQDPARLRPLWYAVVNDLGLLLGDCAIERHPHLRWEMWSGGPKDRLRHRHVITGRPGAHAAPVDFDGLLAVIAHRSLVGKAVPSDHLVRAVEALGD